MITKYSKKQKGLDYNLIYTFMNHLKLFEEHTNSTVMMPKKNAVKLFCEKVLELFEKILKSNHKINKKGYINVGIVLDNYEFPIINIVKMGTYKLHRKDKEENDTVTLNYDHSTIKDYPFLIEYILSESSLVYKKNSHYFDIFQSDVDYKKVNNVNFSKEGYEAFKDAERFGL